MPAVEGAGLLQSVELCDIGYNTAYILKGNFCENVYVLYNLQLWIYIQRETWNLHSAVFNTCDVGMLH